ncbi:MAG: hypothetical protein QOF19_3069 [Alphaproteobacteria bacterium]|nr:hypothetical protein [Alphaproteobacteria bacterium]
MPLLTPPSPPPARVAELKQKILNATEMLLNQLLARIERRAVPRPPARGRLHKAMERRAPDGFALWRLCNRSSCRRAGGCRRNPWECLPRYLKRRPPDCAAAVVAKWKQLQKDISYIGIDAPEPRTATELDILMAEAAQPSGGSARQPCGSRRRRL